MPTTPTFQRRSAYVVQPQASVPVHVFDDVTCGASPVSPANLGPQGEVAEHLVLIQEKLLLLQERIDAGVETAAVRASEASLDACLGTLTKKLDNWVKSLNRKVDAMHEDVKQSSMKFRRAGMISDALERRHQGSSVDTERQSARAGIKVFNKKSSTVPTVNLDQIKAFQRNSSPPSEDTPPAKSFFQRTHKSAAKVDKRGTLTVEDADTPGLPADGVNFAWSRRPPPSGAASLAPPPKEEAPTFDSDVETLELPEAKVAAFVMKEQPSNIIACDHQEPPPTKIIATAGEVSSAAPPTPRSICSSAQSTPRTPPSRPSGPTTVNRRTARLTAHGLGNPLPKPFARPRGTVVHVIDEMLNDPGDSRVASVFTKVMQLLIMMSVLTTMLQTVDSDPPLLHGPAAAVIETFFDFFFTCELVLRFIVSPTSHGFFKSIFTWVDLVASTALILRVYIGFTLPADTDTAVPILLLFVVPLVRAFKMLRHFETLRLLIAAFRATLEALPVLFYMLLMITLTFSSAIYLVEPRTNVGSLPKAMWLCIVTLTTLGYGDVTPKSGLGYIVVSVLTIVAMLFVAMPMGIIGNAFNVTWNARDRIFMISRTQEAFAKFGYTADDVCMLFKMVDLNGDGELTFEEFFELMKQMNIGMSENRVSDLFESFDQDGSGTLDYLEFVKLIFPEQYHKLFRTELREGNPEINKRVQGASRRVSTAIRGSMREAAKA
eukprot:TRINITY_DN13985_c0_g1_i4.p1 TRINITY_DN13985_c0_g1~~TRINITY_DN13985_c0_g1_i4.p1  ORF type:complete len:760 (+),score=168.60 TRINITY_DN13985_c0_g1_i4:128-2281(+)